MKVSLLELYLTICELRKQIEECTESSKELEDKLTKLRKIIANGDYIDDIPEYEDNRTGCEQCSGCRYCQESTQFDITDEF